MISVDTCPEQGNALGGMRTGLVGTLPEQGKSQTGLVDTAKSVKGF